MPNDDQRYAHPNPHYKAACYDALGDEARTRQALLALAYEQQTANLIAYTEAAYQGGLAVPPRADKLQAVQVQVEERLGLA